MDLNTAIASSRLDAQLRLVDVIAGNLANMNTPGFKAQRMQFSDWLDHQPNGEQVAFSQDRATWHDLAPGPLNHTGNPLDLAISGSGYFTVSTPRGPRLTRDGRFAVMPNGTISDELGDALLDSAGQPVKISPDDTELTVTADGTLSSQQNGQIAKIGVVQPADPHQLMAEGGTTFQVADGKTSPVPQAKLVQGAIEESNVQPIAEVTRLIDAQRTFELMMQYVQAEGDRSKSATDKMVPTS